MGHHAPEPVMFLFIDRRAYVIGSWVEPEPGKVACFDIG